MNKFELKIRQLKQIAEEFEKKIEDGLAKPVENDLAEHEKEIKCIPTYIPSIKLPDSGEAYVLDLGGTNVRAAIVTFGKGKYTIKRGPCKEKMPWKRNIDLEKDIYLNTQTKALESLKYSKECPLGYCFSYPAKSKLNGDAELINWTKEIKVPDVEGKDVGKMLLDHIKKYHEGVKCSKVAVINDTVASLIAGLVKPKVDAYIGLIVGTGTNMAAFIDCESIPKLRELRKEHKLKGIIPINLESGNFNPPHLTTWDEYADKESQNKGKQRFEKAVSGAYLGNIFKQVYQESDFNSETGAEGIAELLNNSEKKGDDYILTAAQIFNRSAKLVAATLAGLIMLLNSKKSIKTVRIVAEGSLFWEIIKGEQYYSSVTLSTLKFLLNELSLGDIIVEFKNIQNANLIGSAIAALA